MPTTGKKDTPPIGEFEVDQPTPVEMPALQRVLKSSKKVDNDVAGLRDEVAAWRQLDDEAHERIESSQKDTAADVRVIKSDIAGMKTVVNMAAAAADRAAEAVTTFQSSQLTLVTVEKSQALINQTGEQEKKRTISTKVWGFIIATGGALIGWLTHGGLH